MHMAKLRSIQQHECLTQAVEATTQHSKCICRHVYGVKVLGDKIRGYFWEEVGPWSGWGAGGGGCHASHSRGVTPQM